MMTMAAYQTHVYYTYASVTGQPAEVYQAWRMETSVNLCSNVLYDSNIIIIQTSGREMLYIIWRKQ